MSNIHISVLILSVYFESVHGENYQLSRHDQKRIKTETVYITKTAGSVIHCSATCVADDNCGSISYNSVTKECLLSEVYGTAAGNIISDIGWTVFTKTVPERNCSQQSDVTQWVSTVTSYSSQYNDNTWAAHQVEGPPDVYPRYGDIHGSWAQGTLDSNQYLELKFPEPLHINCFSIYETYHAGGVKTVLGKNPGGNWQELWTTNHVQVIRESRIFSPQLQYFGFAVQEVRLDVDCTASSSWVEIDAVQMAGTRN